MGVCAIALAAVATVGCDEKRPTLYIARGVPQATQVISYHEYALAGEGFRGVRDTYSVRRSVDEDMQLLTFELAKIDASATRQLPVLAKSTEVDGSRTFSIGEIVFDDSLTPLPTLELPQTNEYDLSGIIDGLGVAVIPGSTGTVTLYLRNNECAYKEGTAGEIALDAVVLRLAKDSNKAVSVIKGEKNDFGCFLIKGYDIKKE